jgi:tetratricopeptide (TPR) repeat protein
VARKYTRKQLKKPDEFISLSMRVWSWVQARVPKVLLSLGVAAVILAAVWIYNHYATRAAGDMTEKLSRALEIYNQTIVQTSAKLEPDEDGIPRFKTRADKLKAADAEFSKLVDRGGRLGTVALGMRAGARLDAGRYSEAIADYKKFLERGAGDQKLLRERAIEDLGYCYEATKDWDRALEQYRRLPRDGDRKFVAMLHEARVLANKGQIKDAVKLLREIVDKGGSAVHERASDQLALLEAK